MKPFISDHVLNWLNVSALADSPRPKFTFDRSPHHHDFCIPKYLVLHYTAGASMASTAAWCKNPDAKVSYHFLIGRSGDVCQMVKLNDCAWHAGKSCWDGTTNINAFSVGIGLCNWGPLRRDNRTGEFFPYFLAEPNKPIPSNLVMDAPAALPDSIYRYWERYPSEQIHTLTLLVHALSIALPIDELVGHYEISPNRKIDPGPALDLLPFKALTRLSRAYRVAHLTP